jgi:hypothetical protein
MNKLKNSVCLLAIALAAVTAVAVGQASRTGPQELAFQGGRPVPPGSGDGGGVAFQGTRPVPPGSGDGGGVSA